MINVLLSADSIESHSSELARLDKFNMKDIYEKIRLLIIVIQITLNLPISLFAFEEQYEFEVLDSSSIYTYNSVSCFDNLNCVLLKLRSSMGSI